MALGVNLLAVSTPESWDWMIESYFGHTKYEFFFRKSEYIVPKIDKLGDKTHVNGGGKHYTWDKIYGQFSQKSFKTRTTDPNTAWNLPSISQECYPDGNLWKLSS